MRSPDARSLRDTKPHRLQGIHYWAEDSLQNSEILAFESAASLTKSISFVFHNSHWLTRSYFRQVAFKKCAFLVLFNLWEIISFAVVLVSFSINGQYLVEGHFGVSLSGFIGIGDHLTRHILLTILHLDTFENRKDDDDNSKTFFISLNTASNHDQARLS
jgi:hypothetical protein